MHLQSFIDFLSLSNIRTKIRLTLDGIYIEHYHTLRAGSHASAICAPIDLDERRIWSVKEYVSSFGKDLDNSNIKRETDFAF
jgi:hypothetical protein